MKKKTDLPVKTCPVCEKPFSWRKKWEKNWEAVTYCSKRCRLRKNATPQMTAIVEQPAKQNLK